MVLSVAAATLLSWLIYLLVIARFRRAPALMSTVVTVFIAQALAGVQPKLLGAMVSQGEPGARQDHDDARRRAVAGSVTSSRHRPALVDRALRRGRRRAGAARLAAAPRRLGLALRAKAPPTPTGPFLGVDTEAVARRAWAWCGLLGGLGAVLSKAATGAVTLDPTPPMSQEPSRRPRAR